MAAFDSAIAIDDSGVIFGDQADVAASANADAAAEAISVDGIAAGNAVVTAAVGVLDSNVTVGADATVDVDQIGVADASSDTVNRTSVVAAGATSGALGDRVIDATTGATLGYIINASTGAYAATPDSSVVSGTLAAGNLLAGSSAFAGFTGRTGGMIDDGAIAADLVVGDGGAITVDAGNLADAEASNVDGDAYATARINETLGLDNVEVSVGASGSLFANVDADALASAVSVGDPTVTAAGNGADANADADATTVVGIQDFDAIVFGDNATVTARAGSSADRVTVAADATTETGNATADADATTVAGILDTQDGAATTANLLQVGNDGRVTGVAFSDFDAAADTTSGDATADATVGAALGIQVDEIVVGDGGVVQGQADTQINVSANTVDGIVADEGDATATATLTQTKGLDAEELTIGNDAVLPGGYGVLGRVDADLVVSATNVGDSIGDQALADGQLNVAAGLELGNGTASAQTALSVGDAATIAGVADVTNAATASSVDGDTEAVAKLGADDATASGDAVLGIDLNDAAEIGSDGTILAQALVDLDATATTAAGVAGTGTTAALAGAELVAGLDIDMASGDVTSIGADGTITALAQVDANAVASSTEGDAGAEVGDIVTGPALGRVSGVGSSTMNVVGLQANQTLAIGDAGVINADASVDLVADAASISGIAGAEAKITNAAGLEQSGTLTIGANGTIDADSVITGLADADTVGNASGDDAVAAALATANTGADTNVLSIGDSGTFTATADSSQTATATSVAGSGLANAATTTNIGLDANGATTIGADGTVRGEALSENSARAESTDESAFASADSDDNVGVDSEGLLSIGAGGSLTGVADLDLGATAITVGDNVADQAIANAGTASNNIALALDAAGTTIGATGTVIGDADLDASASASAVEATVTADVDLGNAIAIDLAGAAQQTLSIGDGGTIGANSRVGSTASASTTDGDATAEVDVALTAGLGDGSGIVSIGNAAVVDADAVAVNSASAAAIDALSLVSATVDNDRVSAIDLTSLTAGSNGALDADAASTQTANASNIGDPRAVGLEADAEAIVALNDEVYGITSTALTVGGNATQLTASATLSGSATSSNHTGSSTAFAGQASEVVALNDASNVVVGDSATAGMAFQAVNNLTANASAIELNAQALAGATSGLVPALRDITAVTGVAAVTGVNNSNLTVGEDAGTILASASSTLSATASTNGTDNPTLPIDDNAEAVAAMIADGLLDSAVSVGDDGNLTATATLNGTATATNIGDVATNTNDAFAQIQLSADGLQQTGAETITIGASGNVLGQALVDGGASATTVSGSAEAKADLDAFGLNLDNAGADITIGEAGNISGLALVGELAGGVLSDQIDILATANLEDASALANVQAAGIAGVDGGTLLTAGPSDGDVVGQALAGANLAARTIGDPAAVTATGDEAIATLQSSTISGIENVDILGGMVGSNLVKGTAFADFDVLAESVKGDASGSSTADAYGIIDGDGDGSITLSGNVQAIAQLSNTVTARTIEGNAVAIASGDAIGLGGYSVTIIGSGAITARADSSSRSLAESVAGRASA